MGCVQIGGSCCSQCRGPGIGRMGKGNRSVRKVLAADAGGLSAGCMEAAHACVQGASSLCSQCRGPHVGGFAGVNVPVSNALAAAVAEAGG